MKSFGFVVATILVRVLYLCQSSCGQLGNYGGGSYQGHGNYQPGGYGAYPSYQGNRGGYNQYNPYNGGNYYNGHPYNFNPYRGNHMAANNPYVSTNDRTSMTSIHSSKTNDFHSTGHGGPRVTSPVDGIDNNSNNPRFDAYNMAAQIKQSVAAEVADALAGTRASAAGAGDPGTAMKEHIGGELANTLKDAGVGGRVAAAMG